MKHYSICLGLLYVLCTLGATAYAQSDVYLCIDANGKKEYRNTGSVKGCKLLDVPKGSTVPAPASAKKPAPRLSASPGNFPKVDDSTQKSRDSDAKKILLDELKGEEQKLDAYKKEYNGGEVERRGDERQPSKYIERVNNLKGDISRTENNIEALKREIGKIK